jgi:hypothetical protein
MGHSTFLLLLDFLLNQFLASSNGFLLPFSVLLLVHQLKVINEVGEDLTAVLSDFVKTILSVISYSLELVLIKTVVVFGHDEANFVHKHSNLVLLHDDKQVGEDLRATSHTFDKVSLGKGVLSVDIVSEVTDGQVTAFFLLKHRELQFVGVKLVLVLLDEGFLHLVGFEEGTAELLERHPLVVLAAIPLELFDVFFVVNRGIGGIVKVMNFGGSIVKADLFELLASEVELLVQLGSRLIELHKLVERTNLEHGLVNFDRVHFGMVARVLERLGCRDLFDDDFFVHVLDV